jgi:hypothetical protein
MKQIVVFANYSVVVFANYLRWKNKECLASRKSGVPGGYEGSEFLTQLHKETAKKEVQSASGGCWGSGGSPQL